MAKQLYIIAGCNGAGKTTASYSILPHALCIKEFVNADEIARGLSPLNPDSMAILAGRLMLQRISELLAAEKSFAIETTLATRSHINLVHRAQAKGYDVHLLFFFLKDIALAKKRVAERVAHGGHDIAGEVIERRYHAGLYNLCHLFMNEVDRWIIYDNSLQKCRVIAHGGKDIPLVVLDKVTFEVIQNYERTGVSRPLSSD